MYRTHRMYGGADQSRGPTYDNYGYQAELASRLHRDWPSGHKQIYVSHSTLYDSWSNMPGEEKSSSSAHCKRCLLIFGIILLIGGIISGIVLAIYFSQPEASSPKTTTPTVTTQSIPISVIRTFDVSLTTNGNFTPGLNDSNSQEYKDKENEVKAKMDAIYRNSSVADKYNGTQVLGFSQGSIIIEIRIIFIIIVTPSSPTPTPAAQNVTKSPNVTTTQQPSTSDLISEKNIVDLLKKSSEILQLDLSKNNTIIVIEITTTPAPTTTVTTPKRTTESTILTTTKQQPAVTTTLTEGISPITQTPVLPPTETSKPSQTSNAKTEQTTTALETKPTPSITVAPGSRTSQATGKPTQIDPKKNVTKTSTKSTLSTTTLVPSSKTESDQRNATRHSTPTTTAPKIPSDATKGKTKTESTTSTPTTTAPKIPSDATKGKTKTESTTSTPTTTAPKIPSNSTGGKTKTKSTTSSSFSTTTAQPSMNVTALNTTVASVTSLSSYTTTSPFITTQIFRNDTDNCNPGLRSCTDNTCIRKDWFCDRYVDCFDGSDEDNILCGRNTTTPQPPDSKTTGNDLDCNFESQTKPLCNYKTSSGVYNWSVIRGSTSSNNTGPDFDHTFMSSNGRFLFTESSYGDYNDNATLTSIIVTTDDTYHSLTFYYHMYGAHMGSLEVYFNIVTEKGLQRVKKWRESGNHGNEWLKGCIEMPKKSKLSVEFIAFRGLNYTSDMAIDDIKFSTDICTSISCTYEDSGCGHIPVDLGNNIGQKSYSWRRMRGENMMNTTLGPKTDFTLGMPYGAFMVADSKNSSPEEKAMFRTPQIKTSRAMVLNFRLFMSGTSLGSMRVNLLSEPDFAVNYTLQESSTTSGWRRICVPIPKFFVGVAEFVAISGNGKSGYIAVDDIALGPETTCEGFTICKFENGIFCNFDVTGYNYRWRRHNSKQGPYIVASGKGAEGSNTTLASTKFTAIPNSSISLRYAIKGTSVLSVWMTEYRNLDQTKKKVWTTEGMMTGVQTMPVMKENVNSLTENMVNNQMDWLTGCFNLPTANFFVMDIVSRKIDVEGGKVAIDWVKHNKKKCEIGLGYNPCDFDEPNLCGYEIDCPVSTQYKWKRTSGSTPTISTGPLRDHTYNNTIGNYLYTEGSVGRTGDKAVVTFQNVESALNTSLRFYYYMSGRDIGALYVMINRSSGNIDWIQEGEKSPFWYLGCVNLPSNTKVNVSFVGVHGNGPLSDIAIDDVHLSDERCPERQISCDFEDEMMCGYTGLSTRPMRIDKSFMEQWMRMNGSSSTLPRKDHTYNSSNGHFLSTINPSKIMSPRFAYGQTMCLQFYYYIQMGKGENITVLADYKDRTKNKLKTFGTYGYSLAQWRHGQMTLVPGNVSFIFSVEQYNQEISSTFFAIDDVKLDYGKCPEKVCEEGMFICKPEDICFPNYKKCDWIKDCIDGSDEINCPANRSTIRLINDVNSDDQGRLEIYMNGTWGTAYSLRWFESNAKVACRQNGYTGYYKSIRFGKFYFGLGNVWQISCFGNETQIEDCEKVSVVNTIPHLYDVGLACYNTACEPGKKVCPKVANSDVVYCLYPNQFCDGDFDCPGGEDEKNCSNCKDDEFSCKNHKCIPNTNRCDGKPDCLDASDEMYCIRRDVENNVEIYYNNNWTSLCDNSYSEAFYSSLCLIMGQGAVKREMSGASTTNGLLARENSLKKTAVGNYDLTPSSKPCSKVKLECFGQECGRRSQKMFDNFVQFGNQAVPTEYPWQAMLLRNGNFHCGASIFNSRWLITAEHCVVDSNVKYEAVVGLLLMQDLHRYPKIQVIKIIHSMNYGSYKGIPINDIALILLEKDIVFNDFTQPVCLPSKMYTAKDYCYLSGWGRDENLVGQSHLQETKVNAISSEKCKEHYDNVTHNSFICFGHDQPNMPSCYGDSGGPLVCRNDRGRFELVGIVSFGLPLCAAANGTPAAFTNVLNFRGWIVDQTRCKMWCPDGKCLYEAETCDGINHCKDRSDELPPKCSPTIACNFDKPYKCGYRNDSAHPWFWSSPSWPVPYLKSKPMIGLDIITDEYMYMLASLNATRSSPARLVSPDASGVSCISFKFQTNSNSSAKTSLKLKAIQPNSPNGKVIWDSTVNSAKEHTFWKLATVSLPKETNQLIFEAFYENPNQYSFIAIDSIRVLGKDCTVCSTNEFQCNNGQCINANNVCDKTQHCSDGSDELNCFRTAQIAGCSSDHFQCQNGKCVLKDKTCDGTMDCSDGSDEENCKPSSGKS